MTDNSTNILTQRPKSTSKPMKKVEKASLPQGIHHYATLEGHNSFIYQLHWSNDGLQLFSVSKDHTILQWDMQIQRQINRINIPRQTTGLTVSPDGQIATYGIGNRLRLQHVASNTIYSDLVGHKKGRIQTLAWDPNTEQLATGTDDHTVRVWSWNTRALSPKSDIFENAAITALAWSLDGKYLAVGTRNGGLKIWNARTGKMVAKPMVGLLRKGKAHNGAVTVLAWHGDTLVSGGGDKQVIFWKTDLPKDKHIRQIAGSDGHSDLISALTFSQDGLFLGVKAKDGAFRIWFYEQDQDAWRMTSFVGDKNTEPDVSDMAFNPVLPYLATIGSDYQSIDILGLNYGAISRSTPVIPIAYYRNAKMIIVGDRDVGKTALASALLGRNLEDEPTLQAVKATTFHTLYEERGGFQIHHEIMLWDMVGRENQRIIHQLYLDNVALALIAFDASLRQPLTAVRYWNRALEVQNQDEAFSFLKKMLVATRTDVGQPNVSQEIIYKLIDDLEFSAYFETSAHNNVGIDDLRQAIHTYIDWDDIPQMVSTILFHEIRSFILDFSQRADAPFLLKVRKLYEIFLEESGHTEEKLPELPNEFDACIDLLGSANLLKRFKIDGLVLLQPELLDAYANAIINAAQNNTNPEKFGRVSERDIWQGNLTVPDTLKIQDRKLESKLLVATIKELMSYEVVFREAEEFIFPSHFVQELSPFEIDGNAEIEFTFEGPVLNIYAMVIVRLTRSKYFTLDQISHHRAAFKNFHVLTKEPLDGYCTIELEETDEGTGKLTLYFDAEVRQVMRYCFEMWIYSIMRKQVITKKLRRNRLFHCRNCYSDIPMNSRQVEDVKAKGRDFLFCPNCGEKVLLQEPHMDPTLWEALKHISVDMDREADRARDLEANKTLIRGKHKTGSFDTIFIYDEASKTKVKKIASILKNWGVYSFIPKAQTELRLLNKKTLATLQRKYPTMQTVVVLFDKRIWDTDEFLEVVDHCDELGIPAVPVLLPDTGKVDDELMYRRNLDWVYFFDSLDEVEEEFAYQELAYRITGIRGM